MHKDLVKLLRYYQQSHDFLFFHIKNDVGCADKRRFYDPRPLGVLKGAADFCILNKRGICFLEIKTLKGRLSDEQRQFLVDVNRLGQVGLVAFGWSDILAKVDSIVLSNDPEDFVSPALDHDDTPGKVLWLDDKGRYVKRRPKNGFSIFLY